MKQSSKQFSEHLFQPGVCPNPYGRGAPAARAKADEAERRIEEQRLLADLGREPSHGERLLVEQVSALIIRGAQVARARHVRRCEMVARLVVRSLGKLAADTLVTSGPRFCHAVA
jgi:hypothetical protein